MKRLNFRCLLAILSLIPFLSPALAEEREQDKKADKEPVKKVLFIGDSMTGWLSERLNAYGKTNGFEVSTIVWDGSTIRKWGATPRLAAIVKEKKPDAVFVSLGMNELFEANPEARLSKSLDAILKSIGDTPVIWVGPPSWPGHNKGDKLNEWLAEKLGSGRFFRSSGLTLARQSKSNPHPTREGMIKWMDAVVEWVQEDSDISFPGIKKPTGEQMSRGKSFVYKRMKETL